VRIALIVLAGVVALVGLVLGLVLGVGHRSSSSAPATVRTVVARAPAPAPAAGGNAFALQAQFVRVVKQVAPSVVQIESGGSLGSGVVFDRAGHVVTNAHVIGGATRFTVTLASGKRYSGRLVGSFAEDDLAVIDVDAPGLKPLEFARSSQLEVGDIVLAVGNPLGLRSSVTQGIVSAVGRNVTEPGGATLPGAIQTSAPINPGNSGGALVDLRGRLVGVPTLAATDPQLGAATGIGFAIPSDTVRDIAGQLIRSGRVVRSHRAFLGIQIGSTFGGTGVYVGDVTPGGPADKAGLRSGDVITSVDDQPTPSAAELAQALAGLRPGSVAKLEILRPDGSQKTVRVTLGEYPGG
jgi:S1-C subfamily serine protease